MGRVRHEETGAFRVLRAPLGADFAAGAARASGA
jgi:hypothetical protein